MEALDGARAGALSVTSAKVDIAARGVSERLELAAARGDAEEALRAAREYVEAGLAIRVCAPGFVAPLKTEPAFGRPFPAQYPGRCVICDQPVLVGSLAVYRAEDRAIAHVACGGRP
jgi:hypothetical protein